MAMVCFSAVFEHESRWHAPLDASPNEPLQPTCGEYTSTAVTCDRRSRLNRRR
jgi:hypothetical protein